MIPNIILLEELPSTIAANEAFKSCFAGIPQMFGCVWTNIFGTGILAALVGLAVVVYIMHKAGLNMTATIPLAAVVLFSFLWIYDGGIFSSLLSIAMLIGFAILGFALFRYFKR